MGILSWVLTGLLVGFLVSSLLKQRGSRLMFLMLVCAVGAVVGGLDVAFLYRVPEAFNTINLIGIIAAFAGAFVTLILTGLFNVGIRSSR